MSNRRFLIYSKPFSDYAYKQIVESNASQRSNLDENEYKILRNEEAIKEFTHNSPLDHVLFVLTKLGKYWDIRFYDKEETADQLEFNAVNQFQFPVKRMEVIEAQAREKIHHISSSEVMISAHICAQNVHSKVYYIAAGIKDMIKKVASFKKRRPFSEQMDEASDAIDELNNLLLNQLNSLAWAKEVLGLESTEIRVLCALFEKRNGAMTLKDIAARTKMEGQWQYFNRYIEKLGSKHLIMNDKNHGVKSYVDKGKKSNLVVYYMITQEGIEKIMKYRNCLNKMTWG